MRLRRLLAAMAVLSTIAATSGCSAFMSSEFRSSAGDRLAGKPLRSYLISAPPGSDRDTDRWARTTSPSIALFVRTFYDSRYRTAELARLHAERLTGVAHVLWDTDPIELDVVLLHFASQKGAATRYGSVVGSAGLDRSLRSVDTGEPGALAEFYRSKADEDGDVDSKSYAREGTVVVEVFGFSEDRFAAGYVTKYAEQQVARLPCHGRRAFQVGRIIIFIASEVRVRLYFAIQVYDAPDAIGDFLVEGDIATLSVLAT